MENLAKGKKFTVTVGIPAYNEEANIKNLLDSILSQRRENFELEKIIVMCDGCTDGTEKIVEDFAKANPIIRLVLDGKRIGKSERLNLLYQMNESDYLIILDADIEPENEHVFEKLLDSLNDPRVAVAAGNARPLPGRTLVEKLIVAKDAWWYEARKNFRNGNNIYNSAGCCFAFNKEFAKNIHFLPNTVNDQEIIYLEAKRQNKLFVFSDKARFFYREAATWNELISRMRRFERQDSLEPYGFDINIGAEYELPFGNKMRGFLKTISRNPFYGITSLFLTATLKFVPRRKPEDGANNPALWEITKSSKKLHKDATSSKNQYSCEIIRQLDGKHENEWRALWEKSNERHFFNSPNFFEACHEAFRIKEYVIIFCYRNGKLCAVLPLSKGRVFGVQAYIVPGSEGNYVDKAPLLADEYSEDIIKTILFFVLNLGHARIAELSESAKSLTQFKRSNSFSSVSSQSPSMSLSSETDILKNMSGDQRRDLNRRLRKNKELLSFEVEGIEALEKAMLVEEGSYRSERNMNFFNNEYSKKFMMSISKHIPNGIKIGVLYMERKPIATVLGFVENTTFYWYHIAFIEGYRGIGPGKIALYLTLDHFKKNNFTRIDLLRGNSVFKEQFAKEIAIQYDFYCSNNFLILIWWRINVVVWNKLKRIKSLMGKNDIFRRFRKIYQPFALLSKFRSAK